MTNFPNANLLLIGQRGMAMKQDAFEYAGKCLGTSPVEKHPDFVYITIPERKKSIGVDDILPLIEKGHSDPLLSKQSIAIVDHFDCLTEQAQNKLLLLLESNRFIQIIGISYGEGVILSTVLSRMYKIQYKPLPKKEFLESCGLEQADGLLMYYATDGVLGLMDDFLKEKALFEDIKNACQGERTRLFSVLHLSQEKDKAAITERRELLAAVMRVMLYAFQEDMKAHWFENACYANRCSLVLSDYNLLMSKKHNYTYSKEDFFRLLVRCVE